MASMDAPVCLWSYQPSEHCIQYSHCRCPAIHLQPFTSSHSPPAIHLRPFTSVHSPPAIHLQPLVGTSTTASYHRPHWQFPL